MGVFVEDGLKPDDRVVTAGLLRSIPGQKVDPQLQKIAEPKTDAKADEPKPGANAGTPAPAAPSPAPTK